MPQAVMALAGAGVRPRTALAVAGTFTVGFRAAHGTVELPVEIEPGAAPAATWTELLTAAAVHADAHVVKYALATRHAADDDPAFEHKRIVSLDPGSAPFQQWYSPTSGEFGELLSGEGAVLKQRRQRLDRLRARVNRRRRAPADFVTQRRKAIPRRKRNLKRQRTTRQLARKLAREEARLAGYMESAHYDAAHFLLERHHLVVAPVLQTGRLMCKDNGRRAGRHLSRAMYMWAHRLFRQRLAYTALKYPGRYVFECSEPGTSKTCTQCGAWKAQLRLGDKVFSCSHCGILVDRQLAGARNNFFAAYGMATGNGWDGVGA
jgi:hypothetical protein